MIILPAIDIHEGRCVRLFQGDYSTAEVVAGDPLETAEGFREQGAHWLHMVDLDGAKAGRPINHELILNTAETAGMHVEVGGGIRSMRTVEDYLMGGASRVILGSAALGDPEFVKEAVCAYGKRIAVGIDAIDGIAAAEGWTKKSGMDYIEVAKRMEGIGVQYIICTDIHKDGTQSGPNLEMLDKLNRAVSCNIIASGGVSSLLDIINLYDLGLYGAIAGKALYAGTLDLKAAVRVCHKFSGRRAKTQVLCEVQPCACHRAGGGYQRGADACLYEQRGPGKDHRHRLYMVLQPQPRGPVEQGGDLRQHPEGGERHCRLR